MKTPEEIAAIIHRHNLTDGVDVRHLEAQIRRELTVREILDFADFLHDGKFTSSAGWERNMSGIVTKTKAEDAALARTWKAITASARFYIGAASVLQMQNAQLIGGYAMADEGDGPTLYDYTLDALIRAVPKEYRKQLDNIQRTADAAREGAREGARAEVQRTLPKVYGKAMNAEPGQDPFTPKPRRKGGGRKQSKDIGDKQVLAVLAAMKEKQLASRRAYSDYVIRNGGDFTNPYTDAKSLDTAVSRYAERNHIKLTFKTSRTGKWGGTK